MDALWVLIPIVAICSGTLKTWMRVRATQAQLGSSTHELEREVAALTSARAELLERIQNLETIVVSQTWQVLQDTQLPAAEKQLRVATVAHREFSADESAAAAANQQRAEQLARRLQ
jgi:hypothetical protein